MEGVKAAILGLFRTFLGLNGGEIRLPEQKLPPLGEGGCPSSAVAALLDTALNSILDRRSRDIFVFIRIR